MERLEIVLEYENKVKFQMDGKRDSADTVTILEAQENGELAKLWPYIQKVCIQYMTIELEKIGKAMSQP